MKNDKHSKNIILISSKDNRIPERLKKALDDDSKIVEASSIDEIKETTDTSFPSLYILSEEAASIKTNVCDIKTMNKNNEIFLIVDDKSNIDYNKMSDYGVYECLQLDFDYDELVIKINRAFKQIFTNHELTTLKQNVAMNYGFDNIIGNSPLILKVKETVQRISNTDISILITGEHGTGKELVAKVIHHHSKRRKNIFMTIDFSIIPDSQIERTLFGDGDEIGLLEKSDSGTVYFKNIEHIPADLQFELTNFLTSFRLNNDPNSKKLDLRILSSTTKNINQLLNAQRFSEDLYYKLCELPVNMPPLIKRMEDIELLIDYFARTICNEQQRENIEVNRSAYELLLKYNWPGNIRELESTVKRAITLCQNNTITGSDIILLTAKTTETETSPSDFQKIAIKEKSGLLSEGQRTLIIKTLNENNWNYTQTAQELGIGRTTLWRKVKKYNLKKETANAD